MTNKICYASKEIAEEALVENRSRHYHSENSGPINVYECRECGNYHFTSQGEISELIKKNKSKIDANREANFWERKLR
ncbi:MAG: hypothetical protein ABJF11_09870 [Reichenbachiella sp.]|uniref:hypothetical protein n=1 Tax=Reichenbachiella sp. TaxID=2184521 RepID=UPI003265037B